MNLNRRDFLILSTLFFATSCKEKRKIGEADTVHWDRDMCERCKMVVSDRKFAAQIIDINTNKSYKFDDLGCATLWLKEEKIPWAKSAKILVTDAKTGKWIDAKTALYTDDSITPMAYGIAAYSKETFPKGKKSIGFDKTIKIIEKIEKYNSQLGAQTK